MAMPPVLFNRNSLNQQLKEGFAKIDASFPTANFYLSISKYSLIFMLFCVLGEKATEQTGKKRSFSNKIFLCAGVVSTVVCIGFLAASMELTFSSFRRYSKL